MPRSNLSYASSSSTSYRASNILNSVAPSKREMEKAGIKNKSSILPNEDLEWSENQQLSLEATRLARGVKAFVDVVSQGPQVATAIGDAIPLPSNETIEKSLERMEHAIDFMKWQPENLSQRLVFEQVKNILEDFRQILLEKNNNEQIQLLIRDFVSLSEEVTVETKRAVNRSMVRVTEPISKPSSAPLMSSRSQEDWIGERNLKLKDEYRQNAIRVWNNVRTISFQMVRSNEFRGILRDITLLLRDLVSDTDVGRIVEVIGDQTQKVADKVVDKLDEALGEEKEEVEIESSGKREEINVFSFEKSSASQGYASARPSFAKESREYSSSSQKDLKKEKSAKDLNFEEAKEEIKQALPSIPDEDKKRLQERVTKLLRKLNSPQYHKALDSLFELSSILRRDIGQPGSIAWSRIKDSEPFERMMWHSKSFVEQFVSGQGSLDHLSESFWSLQDLLSSDVDLKAYLNEWRSVISELAKNPTRLDQDEEADLKWRQKLNSLIDRAKMELQGKDEETKDKYQQVFFDFFHDASEALSSISGDVLLQKLGHDFSEFFKLMTRDEQGNVELNTDGISALRKVFYPFLMQTFQKLPLPRLGPFDIHGPLGGGYRVVIDNFVIDTAEILPEHIRFKMFSDVDVNLVDLEIAKARTFGVFSINHMNLHLKGLKVAFKQLSFPHIEDEPTVDLILKDAALTLKMSISNKTPYVSLVDVNCDIHNLSVHTYHSGKSTFYNMILGLYSTRIRKQAERAIEYQIRKAFDQAVALGDGLNQVFPEVGGIKMRIKELIGWE